VQLSTYHLLVILSQNLPGDLIVVMKQSRVDSIIEQVFNIGTGFILSYLVWKFAVHPLVEAGYIMIDQSFLITSIFTVVSFIRSYVIRRICNGKQISVLIREKLRRNI
jgi:hypothetical protein